MPLFKFPRALVRNPAKLEQLQDRVFLPLHKRLEHFLGVAIFAHLGLDAQYGQVPETESLFKHTIQPSWDITGPLQSSTPPQAFATLGSITPANPQDEKLAVALPVLLRNAKEHEPGIMEAYGQLKAAFLETLDQWRQEGDKIAEGFKTKYKAPDTSDTQKFDGLPFVNYQKMALAVLRRRLRIPFNAFLNANLQASEVRLGGDSIGNNLGALAGSLYEELNRAFQGPADLRPTYESVMAAHATAAREIMEAISEVLALVSGENPPLEYNAASGLLTFEERQTRFNQDTISKAVFDYLVLRRSASREELNRLKEQVEGHKKARSSAKSAKSNSEGAKDPKDAWRTTMREINDKLEENKIPLRVDTVGSTYRLSATVDLPEVAL